MIDTDNLRRGETIMELAHEMGAKKFIHYSFPRHMSIELLAREGISSNKRPMNLE